MRLKSLSIFFPFYNDEYTIISLTERVLKVARSVSDDYEVILVNDGSSDNTKKRAEYLKDKYPEVRVVNHKENRGYGGALISGFSVVRKDWVFYTDGDAQYDVGELKKLVDHTCRSDVINGYKIKRMDSEIRYITGKLYYLAAKLLYDIKIKDVTCDFRLIKKEYLDKINLESKSGFICVELVKKLQNAGARFHEVAVHHFSRQHGQSEGFKYRQIAKQFKDLIINIGRI